MSKLFLLGNGFDLAHKIKTQYKDFRAYLCRECGDVFSDVPQTVVDEDGNLKADRTGAAGLLVWLIDETSQGEEWRDLEETMGRFRYGSFFDEYDMEAAIEDDDDDEMFHVAYAREDLAHELSLCVSEIKQLFHDWIETVTIGLCERQPRFEELFDEDSLFITFNYTFTLEQIYGIAPWQVCHIHGVQGGELTVGHGNEDNPYQEENFDTLAIQDTLSILFESLKKDVLSCYQMHSDFFEALKEAGVEEIYSFGFSFSNPDLFYLKQLCSMLDTSNITWHLAAFDGPRNKDFEKCIRGCGFKGKFGSPIPEEG